MAADAVKWVDTCRTCAINGRPEKPTPMRRIFLSYDGLGIDRGRFQWTLCTVWGHFSVAYRGLSFSFPDCSFG